MSTIVLVGVLALAIDVGFLLSQRRGAQVAADAAALAGVSALLGGSTPDQAKSISRYYAEVNGIDLGADAISVVVTGDRHDGQVAVEIRKSVQRYFVGLLYSGPWEVGARAVAEVTDSAGARYSLVALDSPGISIDGSMTLTVRDGSVISNDDITASSGSHMVTADGFIDAVGTINENTAWSAIDGIREHRSPIADPFAPVAVPVPDPMTLEYTADITCPDICTLTPGHYQDVTIQVFGEMTLATGTYYFDNSSITLMAAGSRLSGSGVTLYFDGTSSQAYFKPRSGEVQLTAPSWPTPAGDAGDMAIWIDNCTAFEAQSGAEISVRGVLYAPCSAVTLRGNPSGETVEGMVVASAVRIEGATDVIITGIPFGPTESYEVYLRE